MWCFYQTENYADCVLTAANLGLDTDTVAAVAGGLAGLNYGLFPEAWVERLRGKDLLDDAVEKMQQKFA